MFRLIAKRAALTMIVVSPAFQALADDAPAAPAPPSSWASSIKLSAQIEGGVVFNTASPKNNFGQLFTDKSNQAQLNQILLTAARTIDPKETGWDVGFKVQFLYGSDARYTHFLGELDRVIGQRYQVDFTEANITVHAPILTEGGIDLKLGQYSTPIGFETIDPSTNAFYSHSYIFNFGVPLKHTGGYATIHATPVIDGYIGVDSGVNTSIGNGDNNASAAVMFGFGLNLLDGNLTILALSHIGPENATIAIPRANKFDRYLNDIVLTYKANEKLSFTTEANYIRDDYFKAEGYGLAQYASYALTDQLTMNGRAEVYRDNRGFFVGAFPGNLDFVNAEAGRPATIIGAAPTTYGALTFGVTYKPTMPAPIGGLTLRPEIRYDRSLNGTRPFNGGSDKGAFTLAADAILAF
jgi:hypothetical protein